MKPHIVNYGTIKNNKLALNNPSKFLRSVQENFKEGELVTIILERLTKIRSIKQNRLYFLYLNIIENETGNSVEELHEFFKNKFLPPRLRIMFGEEVELSPTTTKLSKLAFAEYLEKICDLTDVPIPETEQWLYGEQDEY